LKKLSWMVGEDDWPTGAGALVLFLAADVAAWPVLTGSEDVAVVIGVIDDDADDDVETGDEEVDEEAVGTDDAKLTSSAMGFSPREEDTASERDAGEAVDSSGKFAKALSGE
jgi:hypothetical protein